MPLRFGVGTAVLLLSLQLVAQEHVSNSVPALLGTQIPTARPPLVARPSGTRPRQEPCWQEAGISKAAMQQRRNIEQGTRAEIASVCANSSLTPQQRREQIRAIRERSRQQIDAVISPQQREAIKACQEARGKAHRGGGFRGSGGGHGEGPCGELNERKEPTAEPEP